jgi:hypothetical protein
LNIFKGRFFLINESHGAEIADWLNSNPAPPPQQPVGKNAEPAEPQTPAASEPTTSVIPTPDDVKKKESFLLYINYYLPFLPSYSVKLLDRVNEVIKEGNLEKIEQAYKFLRSKEDDLNKIVEKHANKWLERVMVKQNLNEKLLVRNEMPDAIRQSKVIQSYFAALIPPGEK